MNIQEVRAKYPQYRDMSDMQLADALHDKFYADMPKDEFYGKIGLKTGTTVSGVASEATKGFIRGAGKTAEIIPQGITSALPPFVRDLARRGLDFISAPSQKLVTPTPSSTAEQMVGTGSEIAGAVLAGGPTAARNVILPAVGGSVGEQVGGETGKLVGVLAPTGIQLAAAPVKNLISRKVGENLETFRTAGTAPSIGQATGNSFFQGLENLASKFPGGSGVMQRFVESQQKQLGASTRTGITAEDAGRAIEKGVKGAGGFMERTKATWNQMDDALAAKVGGASIVPGNTMATLDTLTAKAAGAERTTAALVNPKLAEMKANLQADMQASGGQIPFKALRALRSRVGSMLDDSLVSGIPNGELKALYKGLSKDLEEAANVSGAGREFARQNNFYSARMARVEDVLERVIGKGKQPEDIFKTINPTNPDQAGKLRAVMRSLDEPQRKTVTDAVVNRLGRAAPGKQDEFGEVFSSETFLTNWNRLSSRAKATLFPDATFRQNLESVAKAASTIREGSRVFQNASGTAGSFAAYSVYASPIAAVATGSMAPVLAAGGAASTAYVGAKMLTSPRVVEWLSKPVNPAKAGEAAAHLARLATIYSQTSDPELKAELEQFVGTATKR